jgi:hypothetical protein
MAQCQQCGRPLREGAAFCTACGTPVPSFCEGCGATLDPEAQFCGACGRVVGGGAPTAVTAQSGPLPQPAGPGYVVATPAAPAMAAPAGLGLGEWLVLAGGLAALFSSFLSWGFTRGSYEYGEGNRLWVGADGWRVFENVIRYFSWSNFRYSPGGLLVVILGGLAVIFCVVAAILSLIRGLSGSNGSPRLIAGFGIFSVVVLGVVRLVDYAANHGWDYRWYPGVGFALGTAGAVCVCVGAFTMLARRRAFAEPSRSSTPGSMTAVAPYGQAGLPGSYVAPLGAPGIGIAGFVLVLVGLFVPLVGILGFILSWVGYAQAKREDRPSGLALAGTILGAVAILIGILILVFVLGIGSSAPTYYGE